MPYEPHTARLRLKNNNSLRIKLALLATAFTALATAGILAVVITALS